VIVVVAAALVGLMAGPFINVLVDRIPGKEPLLPLRADCPAGGAGHPPPPYLRGWWRLATGRCPGCGRGLPRRYLVVEFASVALCAAAAVRLGSDWALPAYLVFFTSLLALSVIDLAHFIIPNRIVYPTLASSVVLLTAAAALDGQWSQWQRAGIGAAISWGLLLVVHLISPRGMGFGDVRLAAILGLFLGWLNLSHVLAGLFMGFLLGALVGVLLVVFGRRKGNDAIPFGPFLATGAVVTVLAGGPIVRALVGG